MRRIRKPDEWSEARNENLLKHRLAELETIHAISQASARQLDFAGLVDLVGEKIRATFSVQSAFIALLDAGNQTGQIPYWVIREQRLPKRQFDPTKGLIGHILRTRSPLLINDDYMRVSEALKVVRVATLASTEIPRSWLGVPIFDGDQPIGVMAISNYDREHAFTNSTAQFLNTLAASVATAFRSAQMYQALLVELENRTQSEERLRLANQELAARLEEIELLQIKTRELAIRDVLTGLYNRRYMEESFEREIARAVRTKTMLSIVMIDIDKFKSLNDSFGHKAGDLMLQKMGELLLARTRRSDVACRYGGEEFILLMPGASLSDATERAQDICRGAQTLRVPFGGVEHTRTLSLGVAAFPNHGNTSDKVVASADAMLYAAKHSGRNRVMVAQS
jgi:diguanylate cyclase (GGDEF)-like protein